MMANPYFIIKGVGCQPYPKYNVCIIFTTNES